MYTMKYSCVKTGLDGRTAAHHACIPREPLTARLAGTAAQAMPVPGCRAASDSSRSGWASCFRFASKTPVCYPQPAEGDGLPPAFPTRTPVEGPAAHKIRVSEKPSASLRNFEPEVKIKFTSLRVP